MPNQQEIGKDQAPSDLILTILDRAHDEITWVRSAYKFAVSFIAVLIAIGLYFSHKSIQDMKTELREEGKQSAKQLAVEMQLISRSLQQDFKDEADQVRKKVSARLDKEFEREEITTLVIQKTQERIDSVANHLIETQVSNQINPLGTELTDLITRTSETFKESIRKLEIQIESSQTAESEMRHLLTEARRVLNNLEKQSDFVMLVLAAQSDDRQALVKLNALASDDSSILQAQARRSCDMIVREYAGLTADKPYRNIKWNDGFDQNIMTFQQVIQGWQQIPSEFARAYVEFVWIHPNITKEEKLSFLHDVLSDSRNSLQAANQAAKLLAEEAKIEYNPPLNFTKIEKWWQERTISKSSPDATSEKSKTE